MRAETHFSLLTNHSQNQRRRMDTAVLRHRNACCENSHHENKIKNTYNPDGGPLESYSLNYYYHYYYYLLFCFVQNKLLCLPYSENINMVWGSFFSVLCSANKYNNNILL